MGVCVFQPLLELRVADNKVLITCKVHEVLPPTVSGSEAMSATHKRTHFSTDNGIEVASDYDFPLLFPAFLAEILDFLVDSLHILVRISMYTEIIRNLF